MFKTVDLLNRGLSGASLRQNILSNNLANANTPNFKRSDVSFASELMASPSSSGRLPLYRTHNQHLQRRLDGQMAQGFSIHQDTQTVMRNDGNNVDVDREMVMVMENQLHYQAMADVANRRLSQLRNVIGEGR